MIMYDFQICTDVGEITYICASCRKEAIQMFCKEKCINEDYVRKHCLIRNVGRAI